MADTLVQLTKAERMLAQCSTVADVVDVVNLAEAARILALKAKLGLAAQNHAALIKLKAERKAGEILAQLERGKTGPKSVTSHDEKQLSEYAEALRGADIDHNQSSRWQTIAKNYTDDDLEQRAAEAVEKAVELTQSALLNATKKDDRAHVANL